MKIVLNEFRWLHKMMENDNLEIKKIIQTTLSLSSFDFANIFSQH